MIDIRDYAVITKGITIEERDSIVKLLKSKKEKIYPPTDFLTKSLGIQYPFFCYSKPTWAGRGDVDWYTRISPKEFIKLFSKSGPLGGLYD